MIDEALKQARFEKLLRAMDRDRLDAVAIVPGANFYFLTGVHFHLMERPTVLFVSRDGSRRAVIPTLEMSRWKSIAPDVETVFWQDSDGYADAFGKIATRISAARVGVEGQRMRVFEFEAVGRALPSSKIVDAHAAISHIRLHKDASEIETMRKAIAISEAALSDTLSRVRKGMSEAEVKRMLLADMSAHGADGPAFEPIVLVGAAAADPHGESVATRKLHPGGALLIDFGAAHGGYAADITRTFFVEQVSNQRRDVYEAVRAANEVGRSHAAPGTTMHDLDSRVAARMREAGFGDLIVHKTGHGLGLDIHEAPQVMVGNMQQLEPGMVVTIEPGLYRPGDVGVRIEDDFLVTNEGGASLTTFERALTLVG
ncbi:MAG TPA: Xaa-Pro peptidase family protein [Roseiarcus sp.]|nr:Xaa-Pro peptidase family protein [Roseiarcus sp.]